jgi:hypothetical protein
VKFLSEGELDLQGQQGPITANHPQRATCTSNTRPGIPGFLFNGRQSLTLTHSKVTTAPSRNTSYVVVGQNAGESKLKKIAELSIKTLTEDGFLELIGTRGGGDLDEKQQKAREKEEKKVMEQAKAMEAREKEEEKLMKRKMAALSGTGMPAK